MRTCLCDHSARFAWWIRVGDEVRVQRKLILRTAAKSEILLGADLRAAIRLGVGVVRRAVIFAFDQATLQKLEDSSRMKILGDGASRLRLYLCMSGVWGG